MAFRNVVRLPLTSSENTSFMEFFLNTNGTGNAFSTGCRAEDLKLPVQWTNNNGKLEVMGNIRISRKKSIVCEYVIVVTEEERTSCEKNKKIEWKKRFGDTDEAVVYYKWSVDLVEKGMVSVKENVSTDFFAFRPIGTSKNLYCGY